MSNELIKAIDEKIAATGIQNRIPIGTRVVYRGKFSDGDRAEGMVVGYDLNLFGVVLIDFVTDDGCHLCGYETELTLMIEGGK